jgi:hypothetical protein
MIPQALEKRYQKLYTTPSSINEHLPVLRHYASQCAVVAELGVDIGQSTTAFLMAQPRSVISVDLHQTPELDELARMGKGYGLTTNWFTTLVGVTAWEFWQTDSRQCTLPRVDLLLIDSAHYYEQTKQELERHAPKVNQWILLHDTVSYGLNGEGGKVGIMQAITEFLAEHGEWSEREHLNNNNGLMVLERR